MKSTTQKPKKSVPPATEEQKSKPEPEAVEAAKPVALTAEQRLDAMDARFEQNEKEIEDAFKGLLERLKPIIALADNVKQAQEAQQAGAQPVQGQPQRGGGFNDIAPLMRMFMQQESNPLQEKLNQISAQLLEAAFEKITKPSKFEQFFEEEIAKSKAKAMAAAISRET